MVLEEIEVVEETEMAPLHQYRQTQGVILSPEQRAAWDALAKLMRGSKFTRYTTPREFRPVVWRGSAALYFEYPGYVVYAVLPEQKGPGEFHVYNQRLGRFHNPYLFKNIAEQGEEPHFEIIDPINTRQAL